MEPEGGGGLDDRCLTEQTIVRGAVALNWPAVLVQWQKTD